MGRKTKWPPAVYPHRRSGRDRMRWQGRDYWLGVSGSPEARARYLVLLDQIQRHGGPLGKSAGTSGFTVEQLVDWWAEWAPRNYRPTSREPRSFRQPLEILRGLFGPTPAAEFDTLKLMAVQAEFGRRYCRAVANRNLTRIKTVFKRAGKHKIVPTSVYAELLCVEAIPPGAPGVREREPVEAADDADLAAVVARCPAPVAALLEVARLSGMRPGEGRLMLARQVERRADGSLVYRRTPADGHKGAWLGRTRVVVFGPRAARIISPWLHAAADGGYVFRPGDGRCERAGRQTIRDHYSDNTLPQAVRRAAKAAGVTLTARQLRHAFKLDAIDAGGVGAAMASMGQTSSQAFDGYGKRGSNRAVDELAKRIG